jgi:hypothetical protein
MTSGRPASDLCRFEFRVTLQQKQDLLDMATRRGVSMSDVIRNAIDEYWNERKLAATGKRIRALALAPKTKG